MVATTSCLLRQGDFAALDVDNLVEELEALIR